jgi:hypothetical protein
MLAQALGRVNVTMKTNAVHVAENDMHRDRPEWVDKRRPRDR